jgi:hypothetical protein
MVMETGIGERVTVGVIFGPGTGMRPAWLHFGGRKVRIDRTNYSWTERQGQSMLYHYSVSGGGDVYHLVFSSEELIWHLEHVSLAT